MAADVTATFAVKTEADSSETDKLAASLEEVNDRMVSNQRAVSELNAALRRMKEGAQGNTEEFKKLKQEIAEKKAAVAADQAAMVKMAGSATAASKIVGDYKAKKAEQAAAEQAAAVAAKQAGEAQAAAAKKASEEATAAAAKKAAAEKTAAAEAAAAAKKAAEEQAAAKVKAEAAAAKKRSELEAKSQAERSERQQRAAARGAEAASRREAHEKRLQHASQAEAAKTAQMNERIGSVAMGAAGIAVAAMLAVYAAVGKAAVAFLQFAVAAADAARSAALLREATTGSAAGAAALDGEIGRLASKLPGTRAELEGLALTLVRAGFEGRALALAFSAVGTVAAVMGQQAGGIIQGIAERAKQSKRFILGAFDLKGTGLQIADVARALAGRLKISFQAAMAAIQNGQVGMEAGLQALDDAVQKRFGAVAAKMKLALPNQIAKAKEDLGRLFAGVNIEPFLLGLSKILGLLDENSATGQALKVIFETMLNPLSEGFGQVAPLAQSFLKGAVIGALQLTIALLTLRNQLRAVTKDVELPAGSFDLLQAAASYGAGAVFMFATKLVAVAAVGVQVVRAMVAVYTAVSDASNFLASIDFGAVAAGMIQGLVNGITSGAGAVYDAIRNLASNMLSTIKGVLMQRSPSRAMRQIGIFAGKGLELGVEDSEEGVEGAAQGAAQSALRGAGKGAAATNRAGGAGRGGGKVEVHITINGVRDAEQLEDSGLWNRVAALLERAARAGGAPVGAPIVVEAG